MKINALILFLFLSTSILLNGQDISNCSGNTVVLQDDMNNFSSSAIGTITFDQNCGCNSVGKCQVVSIVIPDNYTCQGLVVQMENSSDWYDDLFDIYYLPDCTYHGNDDNPIIGQVSNYLVSIDPIQTGGTFDMLICAGDDLPQSTNSLDIYFGTSDLCFIEDCSIDIIPPTCLVTDIVITDDGDAGFVTVDFSNYISDNCDHDLVLNGFNPNTNLEFSISDDFDCDTETMIDILAVDDAQNSTTCTFNVLVNCEDACDNEVIHFDGVDDQIELDSPLNGDQGFTIELWVKSESNSTGSCTNNASTDLDWILSFDDNNLGIVDCSGDLRVIFRPLCPFGNGLCSSLPSRPLNDNQWHHIAISESQATGFRVYYDGIKFTNFDQANYNLDGLIRLGNNFGNGAGNNYRGGLDEFRIWDYVRSEEEIMSYYNCAISSDMDGLVVYYDFEDGVSFEDNSSIDVVDNSSDVNFNGSLNGFTLNGMESNFICNDVNLSQCEQLFECTEVCQADEVDLSTGVDFNTGALLPVGEYEGGWQMISGPDAGLDYPLPGFVLVPNGSWGTLDEARYISPFANTNNNEMYDEPYLFERQFCVCEDTEVQIDMSALVDNFIDIGLYDDSGTLIETLISYNGAPSTSTFLLPAFTSTTTHSLTSGVYSLRAGLRNDGGVSMGMSIEASVSGVGLIESKCCSPFATITGTVFTDNDCDSNNDFGSDMGLVGKEVVLCTLEGEEIGRTATDAFGYYIFRDLEPGGYLVKQSPALGLNLSLGADGYQIDLGANVVIGDLDFGNCPSEFCTADCQADVVDLGTGVDFNTGALLPVGEYEGGWQMISGPDAGLDYPLPGFVLVPNGSWGTLDGARYISPFANTNNNEMYDEPYLFERQFCVCEDTEVQIDVSALVDNFIDIGLYDDVGTLIETLISYNGAASTSTFLLPAFTSTTTHSLTSGVYSLRAGLRNDGGVSMGMSIEASVSGVGLIESKCCSPFATITGTVFTDNDCDSDNDFGSDMGLVGKEVVLCTLEGEEIDRTMTDAFGYYIFRDLEPGGYLVKQSPSSALNLSLGVDGYQIDLGANTVIGDLDFGNCPPEFCTEECQADVVDLGTGVDFNTGSLLPVGEYEGGWQMISGPDAGLDYPLPGFVLVPNSSWGTLDGARYISPFANTNNNKMYDEPYLFERQFCVCEDTEVQIDMSALVDNFIDIGLYDDSGTLIETLISYGGAPSTSTFLLPAFTSTTTHSLTSGVYSLRAGLRNDGGVSMGMSIEASVSGVGLIESKCCSPFAVVTGTVFTDIDCDSNNDFGSDMGLAEVEVVLCTMEGIEIGRTSTDAFGYYIFRDVEPGAYLVKQLPSPGLNLSLGADGYQIDLGSNMVVGDLDFGNCDDPCIDDIIPPSLSCISVFNVELNQGGTIFISIDDLDVVVADDCGEAFVEFDGITLGCNDIGEVHITLIAQDESGNVNSCEVTVNLTDPSGFCVEPCCATAQELTSAVSSNVGVSSLICNDLGEVSLEIDGLYNCQSVTNVLWGDGSEDQISNGNIPDHLYSVNGVYLISVTVTSHTSEEEVCQEDIADIPVFIKNCDDVSTVDPEFALFQIYPIPSRDFVNIRFGENTSGYTLQIFSVDNQLLNSMELENGIVETSFSTADLSSGLYYLIVSDQSGNKSQSRFIVSK